MPSDAADIVNVALARIGENQYITALTQACPAARAAQKVYANARNSLLCAFPWQFATGRSTLALVTDGERTNWLYAYALPADCLFARYIPLEGFKEPEPEQRIAFSLEADATLGKVLVTDEAEAELVYTLAVEAVALFPPLFVDALAWKLAAELALALPKKPQVGLAMDKKAVEAFRFAAANDFRQSQNAEGAKQQASYIRARRGG